MWTLLASEQEHSGIAGTSPHTLGLPMKTPITSIDHNFAEIVEYLPLPHIIWDLGQKQVLSQSEVEKINKDNDYASKLLTVLKSTL